MFTFYSQGYVYCLFPFELFLKMLWVLLCFLYACLYCLFIRSALTICRRTRQWYAAIGTIIMYVCDSLMVSSMKVYYCWYWSYECLVFA